MEWTFEISFLVFLILIFIAQTISTKSNSILSMPLILGVLAIIGFQTGILQKDFIEASNMIVVGTIAYNLLVINSGTMINTKFILKDWKNALVLLVSSLILTLIVGFGLSTIIGRELSILSSGSIIGGGATCAIASYMTMRTNPSLSVFPWLIFMFQGLFAVPIIMLMLKKEAQVLLLEYRGRDMEIYQAERPNHNRGKFKDNLKLYEQIPQKYKSTAYYLGLIMLINVMNKWLHSKIGIPLNQNATALLAGFIFGQIGIIDTAPLHKADSFGLLLLGLMGLMVNTLSKNTVFTLLRFATPLLIVVSVSTIVLIVTGFLASKVLKTSPYGRIAMTLNCMVGFPVNKLIIDRSISITADEGEKGYLNSKLAPLLNIGTMLIVNTVSIIIISVMINFI